MPTNNDHDSKNSPRHEATAPGGRFAGVWPPATDAERDALIKDIQRTPIGYGTWRDLKALYKQVEQSVLADPKNTDVSVLAALLGRLDAVPRLPESKDAPRVSFRGISMNGTTTLASLGQDAVVVLGWSYSGGYKRRLVIMEAENPDPLKPSIRGSLDLDGHVYEQYLRSLDSRLYLTSGSYAEGMLEIFETATPDGQPKQLGKFSQRSTGFAAFSAARSEEGGVRGALITAPRGRRDTQTLQILDLTAPEQGITVLSSTQIAGAQTATLLEGGRIVVVATSGTGFSWSSLPKAGGLRVYDLTDPTRPRQIGAMPLEKVSCLMAGGPPSAPLLYAGIDTGGSQSSGVQIISMGNPASPRKLGFVKTGQAPLQIQAHPQRPDILFACPYWGGAIIDVSNPDSPRILSQNVRNLSLQISAAQGDTLWTGEMYSGVFPWYMADPKHPVRIGTPVSPATLGYMKRRGRRALRHIEESAPEKYTEMAARLFLTLGRTNDEISWADNWASMEALFGGGERFVQKNHGRGPYVLAKDAPTFRLSLRRREERRPDLWNAHPESASALLSAKETPTEARELAVRVLRANRVPFPNLSSGAQEKMFQGNSPLLQATAARQVSSALIDGKKVNGPNAADAYRFSGAGMRRALAEPLTTRAEEDANWLASFVRHALDGLNTRAAAATTTAASPTLSRRDAGLLLLICRIAPDLFAPDQNAVLTAQALARKNADLTNLLQARIAKGIDPARIGALVTALLDDLRRGGAR